MNLLRSSIMGLLLATCLVLLAGCSDSSEKLAGAWKTEAINPDTGKASVLLISKDSVNLNGTTYQVEFKTMSLTVEVFDKTAQKTLFIATKINKNDVEISGGIIGEKDKLARITEEEAFALLKEAQPQ